MTVTATDLSGNSVAEGDSPQVGPAASRSLKGPTVCDALGVTLPPEPAMSPLRQTLGWAFRPLPFMNACRRRLGDSFSLRFLGFERPMVLISDPAAIKALYTEREHGLPPGRNVFLEPILGSRSLLLLEGEDHLAHRKLMLPAFHGERMRSYEPIVARDRRRRDRLLAAGREFALHPRMQAITLEVILRVVFGVSEGTRLNRLRGLLARPARRDLLHLGCSCGSWRPGARAAPPA